MIKKPLDLYLYFLKLGATGFGGPLALIASMQKELIEEQKVLPEEEFNQALALIKSMPGPAAVQLSAFIGRQKFGVLSAILCPLFFIAPASTLMILFARSYTAFQASHPLQLFFTGMQAAALTLILGGGVALTKPYRKDWIYWSILIFAAALLVFLKLAEPLVILASGVLALALTRATAKATLRSFVGLDLFWICFKGGAFAFGTGLAIIPLLQGDFVQKHQWLTSQEFMDAVALGQLTPGPVTVTVTFVGYKVAGFLGAAIATLGIYSPGVFNMATWFPRVLDWFSRQAWVKPFVKGAIAAISAGILWVLWTLAFDVPPLSLVLPMILWLASFRYKVPNWALILGSGIFWAAGSLIIGS